jgi:hypothetical protein
VFAGARGRLTTGLLILEALVAVEILVVAAFLPAVQRDLHGLQLYGWNYAALTLASFGAVPIAGRLTDRLGPRSVLGAAIGIYGVGLVLAATAPSMLVLVIARFVQGIGGGGLYVVSLATVAKTYPERIRPRVMALLASMWILPGLLGPPVGAVIAETVGWRWVGRGPAAADRARRRPGDAVAPRGLRERGRIKAAGGRVARADGRRGLPARRAHGPLGVEHPARRRRGRRDDPGAPQDRPRRHPHRPARDPGRVGPPSSSPRRRSSRSTAS